MRSVILLLVALCSSCSSTPRAGIYIDNGHDQTIIEHLMSEAEKKEMETEILTLLGLPHRPRRINRSPLRRSAPRFLLDVYKSLVDDDEDEGAPGAVEGLHRDKREALAEDISLSGVEQQQINESDVIMTFESINHHVSSVRHERGKRLWFNVSEVPLAEDIVGAELRLYKNSEKSSKNSDKKYVVTAYQLIKTENGERELEYVSAINTTADYTGWVTLNVSSCLSTWVAFPESNKGLYLSVHPTDRPGREVRPEDIGLVTVKGDDEIQPFMVAFLKAMNHVKVRTTRSTKTRKDTSVTSSLVRRSVDNFNTKRSCRIETLYISFKDLNWQDWIIAPDGYEAHYCAGECNFPLNAHMNATNHAIVQTLVHLMNPLRYPKPCCAPTRLGPISVLYFLDDSNVMLKKYKQMFVKSCGCH